MRLIRRKIYRAFPELDRFSDDQCARFVLAANSSWLRRLVRWALVGFVTAVALPAAVAGAVALGELLDKKMVFNGTIGFLGWGLLLIAACGAGLLVGLIARDLLLRLRIRRLIHRRGSCPNCHYSLLGMRVGHDLNIVCPECGRKTEADPALGELAVDESGQAIFRPEVVRDDSAMVARRRRRHRAFLKWSAITVATVIGLAASAYGVWWWSLVEQAKVARAERNTTKRIAELRSAMWPNGPGPNSESEWETFRELVDKVALRQREAIASGKYALPDGKPVYFEASALLPTATAADYEKRHGVGSFAPSVRLATDVLASCKADGTTAGLRKLLDLNTPMRTYNWDGSDPFLLIAFDGMSETRGTARFNSARMIVALRDLDREEYLIALEETCVLARVCSHQGVLYEHLVGLAIQSLVLGRIAEDEAAYPSVEWYRGVLEVLLRRDAAPAFAGALEVERVAGLDVVQHFFSEPAKVRNMYLGFGVFDKNQGLWKFDPGTLGTYAANKAAINAMYDSQIAAARQDAWLPAPAAAPPSSLPLVSLLAPAISKVQTSSRKCDYEYRSTVFALAVRLHKQTTGLYPAKPEDLAPLLPDKKYFVDPNTGKPFWFTERQTGTGAAARTVLDIINMP